MKKRNKSKRRLLIIVIIVFIILLLIVGTYAVLSNKKSDDRINIKDYYNEYVVTNKDAKIYIKEEDNYVESGMIGNNVELVLNPYVEKSEYFNIKLLENEYYIYYMDVTKIETIKAYDERYKNYIPFNENISTKERTNLYDQDDNLIYSLNKSMSLPIIIKDTDKYGIEFNDRLLYVNKNEGELVQNHNTDLSNSTGVGVLNYHAFYDETDPDDACPTVICHSKTQFKSHLDFLKDNSILTLKSSELEMYIDGKIQLPKSVLITIDDGARSSIAVDMLTEYKMYATIFLVTSWYDENEFYKTDYIELHSHTHNMHDGGKCPGGQGGGIKCLSEEFIQADLMQSRKELNGSTYFAYPFYEYNEYSIKMLKQAGFTMAFIGESESSDNLVHVNSNKFTLRRFVIVTYTTLNDLNKYFNQIK